jgi:DNA polymerase III gamma/tau subunit
MSSIPPKHTPEASSAADDSPETGGMVALYNAASHASAESFPVLKAFQDYIEAERSQARKRVMQLSIFFAVLMCVVVTGFLTAGVFMFRNMSSMQSNMTTMQSKLLDVALAAKSAPPAPAPVIQTSPVIEESVRQMSRVTTELQSSLDKKLDGVNEIASKVNEKVSTQNGELEKLRTELKQMQEQSAKMKDELVSVKKEVAKKPEPAKPLPPAAPAVAVAPKPAPAAAPVVASAPQVAVAPSAVAAVAKTPEAQPAAAAAPKAEARDPRFPPAVKDPPVTPPGVVAPAAPKGMVATAIPVATKNVGTVPWRVLIPE